MNGLNTRNQLRQASRPQYEGDTKPIDRIIALVCAIGLIIILVWQTIGQVAA